MRFIAGLLLASSLLAQGPFFPLDQVKPGMRGTGRTVFSGDRIEEFQVEILGVLENVGPRQSLVLARLSGGGLERSGVLQGMSGSPVYIDGRLLGAVSAGFPFSKEPIAGIRPIGEMLEVSTGAGEVRAARPSLHPQPAEQLAALAGQSAGYTWGAARLADIATPISFGGFTRRAVEHFAPQLRALGLEPCQGMLGGGAAGPQPATPRPIEPGSMISVQLISGDFAVGADGTVTHVDGDRIYAFGHRFLSLGPTGMPFARAEVLTLLPNLAASFKISAARELAGTITGDWNAAVAGRIGQTADLLPVTISLRRKGAPGEAARRYSMRVVRDRFLSPFLVQMASFSALDATERMLGEATILARGSVGLDGGAPSIRFENTYAGEANVPAQAALAAALPLAYLMQSGFDKLRPARLDLDLEVMEESRQFAIEQIWASRTEVEPGATVELTVILAGDRGAERAHKVAYHVPVGAPAGTLYFTASDANVRNLTEFRRLLGRPPGSAEEVVTFLNGLKPSSRAYVRVWRARPSYQMGGQELPDPPPSVAMILGRAQSYSGAAQSYDSKVAELEVGGEDDFVVTGSKTTRVEVKP